MSADFVDTNVLLYLTSSDERKADIAETLLRSRPAASVQVLNEFANAARRKAKLEWEAVDKLLFAISKAAEIGPLTIDTHRQGIALAQRYQLSIYDAMIVSSALEAGCSTLYTEDMHHGLVVEGRLRIVNPFA